MAHHGGRADLREGSAWTLLKVLWPALQVHWAMWLWRPFTQHIWIFPEPPWDGLDGNSFMRESEDSGIGWQSSPCPPSSPAPVELGWQAVGRGRWSWAASPPRCFLSWPSHHPHKAEVRWAGLRGQPLALLEVCLSPEVTRTGRKHWKHRVFLERHATHQVRGTFEVPITWRFSVSGTGKKLLETHKATHSKLRIWKARMDLLPKMKQ